MSKEVLQKEIDKLHRQIDVINETWNFNKPYSQYERNTAPLWSDINKKYAELSLLEDEIEYSNIDGGDLMPLSEFISCCKDGGFIDSDGFAYYATQDKESNIQINPSWVMMNKIRKDFDHVIWYNK